MTAKTVGFIGLGNMGIPMARCLVAAGYHVLGFDQSANPEYRSHYLNTLSDADRLHIFGKSAENPAGERHPERIPALDIIPCARKARLQRRIDILGCQCHR